MNNIWNIFKKEIKEMFRDKKSLAMMLVIPILIPMIVLGMSALFDSDSDKKIDDYNKIGFSYELSETEKELAKSINIDASFKSEEDLKVDYQNGVIDLYVTKEDNKYIMNGENNVTTTYAISLMDSYFKAYKEILQNDYLVNNHVDASKVINIIETQKNIMDTENFYVNYITIYAFLFIIMAITVSATYPATDATAGEKERGTLETLLTFPIKSKDIIIGKFLSVSLSSFITGFISLLLTIGSLYFAGEIFKIYEGANLMLSFNSLIFALIVIIFYSFLISGLCIAIASKSKTFKEAQSALTPITFISFFPGMIAFMANIKSSALLSLVPFLNFTLLFTDITNNEASLLNIGLMIISTVIIIVVILMIIIKQYKSEKVLFNN